MLCFHHVCTNLVCIAYFYLNKQCQGKKLLSRCVFTIINSLLIDDSSFSKAVQVIQLHFLPRDISDTQVHIPKLLVLLLYPLVQSPCNLYQIHTQRSRNSIFHSYFWQHKRIHVTAKLNSLGEFTTGGHWKITLERNTRTMKAQSIKL